MKNIIFGFIIVVVGVGAGLFLLQRSTNSSATPKNSATRVFEPSVAGRSTTGTTSAFALSVSTPADGATVTTASVTVSGKTTPKADVFINELEARADASGNFSGTLTLDEGENLIVIIANDESGNVVEKDLTIFH